MSRKSKKPKKSFADQLREIFRPEQNKPADDARRIETGGALPLPGSPAQNADVRRPAPPANPSSNSQPGQPLRPSKMPARAATPSNPVGTSSTQPVSTRMQSRIVWENQAQKPVPIDKISHPLAEAKIEWAGTISAGTVDPSFLIGVEDAFDHTPLLQGEQIAFCTRDKVAYHLETWRFLQSQNQGRCCICGHSTGIQMIALPGTLITRPIPVEPAKPQVVVFPGQKIISLKEVQDHLNLAVIVQDYVYKVHRSQKGTYFVRFEPQVYGEPVYSGFKVVIFNDYVPNWVQMGLRIEDYQQHSIRVRGVVRAHEKWGIEILVNSPLMIEVVDEQKEW